MLNSDDARSTACRVLILGGGFGGVYAALEFEKVEKKVRVALDWTVDLCFAKDFACVTEGPPARERVAAVHGLRAGAR